MLNTNSKIAETRTVKTVSVLIIPSTGGLEGSDPQLWFLARLRKVFLMPWVASQENDEKLREKVLFQH